MSFKDLARQLRQPIPGKALSFGAPQSRIQVMVNGQTITAIACNHINSSDVAVTFDNSGQARVWSATSPTETSRRTGNFLHIEDEEIVTPVYYPIKVLFAIEDDGSLDLYIGGDRPKPAFIYKILSSERAESINYYLSNTGRKLNNWVVGLKFKTKVMNIYSNAVYTCQEVGADRLEWKGCGFWSYSLSGSGFVEVNRQATTSQSGNVVYGSETADLVPSQLDVLLTPGSGKHSLQSTGVIDILS